MIKIETHDTGEPVVPEDITEAQKVYEIAKAYRRIIFMRAIAEKKTYRWIADAASLSVGNVYQLVNKTNYSKKDK